MSYEAELHVGDAVLITAGPFADLTGPIRAIDHERGRVQVGVDILGDMSTVDMPLLDVARA